MFPPPWFSKAVPGILSLLFLALLPAPAFSKSPEIIRHDAHIMENEVRLNIAWQSDEPVVKIIAAAGKAQVVVDNDIENERNDRGYSGVIDIVIPYAPYYASGGEQSMYVTRQNAGPYNQSGMEMYANSSSPNREMVQYTVQLVDEINQRSALMKDLVRRPDPAYALSRRKDPRPLTTSGRTITVDAANPMNTAINAAATLIGRIGAEPELKDVKVNYWADNRMTVAFHASDDKGVERVGIEVRNDAGEIAYQSSVSCDGQKQCSKQSETFTLTEGRYVVSCLATDTEGNNSKKYTLEFTATSSPMSGQQEQQVQSYQPEAPSSQAPTSSASLPLLNVPEQ